MQKLKTKAKLNAEFESESEFECKNQNYIEPERCIIVDSHFYTLLYIIIHYYTFTHGGYPLLYIQSWWLSTVIHHYPPSTPHYYPLCAWSFRQCMVDKTDVHFYPIIRNYPLLSTMICVDTVFGEHVAEWLRIIGKKKNPWAKQK